MSLEKPILLPSCVEAFLKNLYNVLDLLAILPLPFRIAYGVQTPTVSDNLVVHSLLYCFVPVVRQLKLIRKFQKLQLLLPLGLWRMVVCHFWNDYGDL